MLYNLTVPQYKKMLLNLSAILDKADVHFKEMNVTDEILFNFRLAPDMFPLSKQIFIACDATKFLVKDLLGKKTTENTYTEKTMSDFKKRIDDAVSALDLVSEKDFEGVEKKLVTQVWWGGKQMAGDEYIAQHSIPTIYFHIVTAYNILRHNGLQIGKMDYLGKLPFKA